MLLWLSRCGGCNIVAQNLELVASAAAATWLKPDKYPSFIVNREDLDPLLLWEILESSGNCDELLNIP
jgi:hypothetical protein